jgi:hypothetical protein
MQLFHYHDQVMWSGRAKSNIVGLYEMFWTWKKTVMIGSKLLLRLYRGDWSYSNAPEIYSENTGSNLNRTSHDFLQFLESNVVIIQSKAINKYE